MAVSNEVTVQPLSWAAGAKNVAALDPTVMTCDSCAGSHRVPSVRCSGAVVSPSSFISPKTAILVLAGN